MMTLLATGFNAWGQLRFDAAQIDESPADLRVFTRVLRDSHIGRPRASLWDTEVETSSGLKRAGFKDGNSTVDPSPDDCVVTVKTATGRSASITSSGEIVESDDKDERSKVHMPPGIKYNALEACATGFMALTEDGDVYTWGDGRYAASLGREISSANPADRPSRISTWDGLPDKPARIFAGGNILAVSTEHNDVYVWGCQPGRMSVIPGLNGQPSPLLIGDEEIIDLAIGQDHMLVLTESRKIFVIGNNGNGQLGLRKDGSREETVSTWTWVSIDLQEAEVAVGVAAGPLSSFILVETT